MSMALIEIKYSRTSISLGILCFYFSQIRANKFYSFIEQISLTLYESHSSFTKSIIETAFAVALINNSKEVVFMVSSIFSAVYLIEKFA